MSIMSKEAILTVNNITKTIKDNVILKNIQFEINKNQVVSILGPSGAGKTTLLRILNGLTTPDSGEVIINGKSINYQAKEDLKKLPESIGLVFQNFNLYPHLTVQKNITLSSLLKHKNNKANQHAIEESAREWLQLLHLEEKDQQYPFQLSGGEKQRVAIARAGILNPEILCFDEPTSALDPLLTQQVAKMVRELSTKMTVLIITHDMEFAKLASDRILVMEKGEIIQDVQTSEYFE
jgi:polar amino acid transport system ATP-binding protein